MQLPDFKGNPVQLIGRMTNNGKIIGWDEKYQTWTISGYGNCGRHQQKQKHSKTPIEYPKLLPVNSKQ